MSILLVFTFISSVFSQIMPPSQFPPQPPVVPPSQSVLMSSYPMLCQNNYTLGMYPIVGAPVIGGNITQLACRRISMFKFPAIATGSVQTMSVSVIPTGNPRSCMVGFTLFSFLNSQPIGIDYLASITIANTGSLLSEAITTLNVSSANWNLVNNSVYYFTIQTFTYDSFGGYCEVSVPLGIPTASTTGT